MISDVSLTEQIAAFKAAQPLSSIIGEYVDLKRCGRELQACCPFHQEKTPSFFVNDEKGTYHCFGCGAGGDHFTFFREYLNMSIPEALQNNSGREFAFFVPRPDFEDRPQRSSEAARQIWDEALPFRDSPADEYLRLRGIWPWHLCAQENLRYAELPFDGSTEKYGALVAAVRDVDGEIQGIQRTFVTPDGKKLCDSAKRSLGSIKGGAIRLSAGEEVGDFSRLYIVEGLEDGLSVLMHRGDAPVWATAGAGMMKHLVLPEGCQEVVIVPDNDRAGALAAHEFGVGLVKKGIDVMFCVPPREFKDYNEYWQDIVISRFEQMQAEGKGPVE